MIIIVLIKDIIFIVIVIVIVIVVEIIIIIAIIVSHGILSWSGFDESSSAPFCHHYYVMSLSSKSFEQCICHCHHDDDNS